MLFRSSPPPPKHASPPPPGAVLAKPAKPVLFAPTALTKTGATVKIKALPSATAYAFTCTGVASTHIKQKSTSTVVTFSISGLKSKKTYK